MTIRKTVSFTCESHAKGYALKIKMTQGQVGCMVLCEVVVMGEGMISLYLR